MPRKTRKRQYGSGGVIPPEVVGGTWAVRIRVNGRRVYRGGIQSRDLAERVLAQLQANNTAEEFGLAVAQPRGLTLGELAPPFLERRKRTHAAWAEDLGRWQNHLAPAFAALRPEEVDARAVRRYAEDRRAAGLSGGTVRLHVALLSGLFEDLLEGGAIKANPTRGLPRSTVRLFTSTQDPRTTPFLERLEDVRRVYTDLPEPLSIGFAVGALAGLRTSEVFGLRWQHVDLAARRIHVREQRGRPTLKDKDSRVVPVLDGLLPLLQVWRLRSGAEPDALVVPSFHADGKAVSVKTPGRLLARTLKRLGLERPGLGWYEATRHTFASHWVMGGGTLEKLREILGHSTVAMTERYAHLRVDLFTARDLATIPLDLGGAPAPVLELKHG
jgi:integrase